MLTFVFRCIKNIGSTSGFVGKVSYTNSFWSRTSSTNFYKATENPSSNSTKNQNSGHRLPGRYALNEPNNRKPGNGKEHIDFSLTGTGVHNKSEKISTVGNPETRILGPRNRLSKHDSNIANGKSKKFDLEIQKTDGKSQTNVVGNSSLIGSLCSTAQAVMPAFLPIRYLQQQQVEYTKKQFSYHSIVHLNQNSIQELIWWVNNLEISNGKSILSPINRTIIQADASQKASQSARTQSANLALLTFHKMFSLKAAHFQLDNTTAYRN